MNRFHYKVVDAAGGLLEGEIEALTELDALQRLKAQGHAPISAEPVGARWRERLGLGGLRSRNSFNVAAFARDMGTLLESGISLDRALAMFADVTTGKRQEQVLSQMLEGVQSGRPLSEVMEEASGVFSRFHINMVRAGEASGALGAVLLRLAESTEELQSVKDSIRTALIYPALLVLITVLSLMLLMVVVVPQFTTLFEDMGRELPLPTRIVSGAGDLMRSYWWAGLGFAMLAVKFMQAQWRKPESRYRWELRLMRWPLVGDLMLKAQMAIFSRTLATLLNNGVPLLGALRIVGDTLSNQVLQKSVAGVAEGVKDGGTLAARLGDSGRFPAMAIHLVRVGEETGSLDAMLLRLAEIYDREVRTSVQRLLALLEPVLIVGLGFIVGGIIMSILVAILSINDLTL
jgi:general secretion pathway protein F